MYTKKNIYLPNLIARVSTMASAELLRQLAVAPVHSEPTNEGNIQN